MTTSFNFNLVSNNKCFISGVFINGGIIVEYIDIHTEKRGVCDVSTLDDETAMEICIKCNKITGIDIDWRNLVPVNLKTLLSVENLTNALKEIIEVLDDKDLNLNNIMGGTFEFKHLKRPMYIIGEPVVATNEVLENMVEFLKSGTPKKYHSILVYDHNGLKCDIEIRYDLCIVWRFGKKHEK